MLVLLRASNSFLIYSKSHERADGRKTKIKTIWHLNIWLIFFVARMRLSTKLLFLQVLLKKKKIKRKVI